MAITSISQSQVVTNLVNELPISTDATTSRVVVNNDLLRQVLFSFDAGQALTEHASPRAVIVCLLEGKMSFTVAGQAHTLLAGDVVYLAPNDPHALEAIEPCRMQLTMVDVAAAQGLECCEPKQ